MGEVFNDSETDIKRCIVMIFHCFDALELCGIRFFSITSATSFWIISAILWAIVKVKLLVGWSSFTVSRFVVQMKSCIWKSDFSLCFLWAPTDIKYSSLRGSADTVYFCALLCNSTARWFLRMYPTVWCFQFYPEILFCWFWPVPAHRSSWPVSVVFPYSYYTTFFTTLQLCGVAEMPSRGRNLCLKISWQWIPTALSFIWSSAGAFPDETVNLKYW